MSSVSVCILFLREMLHNMTDTLTIVFRMLLVRENKRMEREELNLMHGPERERIEEAARLEGITFDEAVRRRKGFRYLY